jgi:hypothetical protein
MSTQTEAPVAMPRDKGLKVSSVKNSPQNGIRKAKTQVPQRRRPPAQVVDILGGQRRRGHLDRATWSKILYCEVADIAVAMWRNSRLSSKRGRP